jgi:hypothetical protein
MEKRQREIGNGDGGMKSTGFEKSDRRGNGGIGRKKKRAKVGGKKRKRKEKKGRQTAGRQDAQKRR